MAAKTDWKDYVPDSKGVRYQLVSNGDGTYNIVDATTYEVVGDKVTAEALNLIGTIINNLISGTQPAGKANDSSKLVGLTPIVDNPGPDNRNTWYFPFTGTNNKDGTRKYYAALYADVATSASNKQGGGALIDTNDSRLSNARRASNITMSSPDANLWILYS